MRNWVVHILFLPSAINYDVMLQRKWEQTVIFFIVFNTPPTASAQWSSMVYPITYTYFGLNRKLTQNANVTPIMRWGGGVILYLDEYVIINNIQIRGDDLQFILKAI